MVAAGRLLPSSQRVRIRVARGKTSVAQTKELVVGFAIFDLKSKEEAIESRRRFMQIHADILMDMRIKTPCCKYQAAIYGVFPGVATSRNELRILAARVFQPRQRVFMFTRGESGPGLPHFFQRPGAAGVMEQKGTHVF